MENLKVVYLFEQTNGKITLKKQLQYIGLLLKRYCVFVAIVICFNAFSQVPTQPQFPTYGNLNVNNASGQSSPYYYQKTTQPTQNNYSGNGMPDPSVMNNWENMSVDDKNRVVMQIHGMKPPPTDEQIKADFKTIGTYKQPELTEYEKVSIEMLNDAYRSESKFRTIPENFNSPEFKAKEAPFENAYNNINLMLTGKKTLSVKDAYFHMENAFGNSYLNYNDYNRTIKESADYIKKWLAQNGYNVSNPENLHLGIQRFMKDTLSLTILLDGKTKSKVIKHLPFKYDYEDFEGRGDHRNFYVTKCFATGYGQCNSLPIVYLILSEALGVKCYLSFAPQHAFIKHTDNKGNIHNYEPTSNYKLNDKWYKDNLHISNLAIQNGIYLDTINKKMIVANCLQDLGLAYLVKLGLADGKFSLKCAKNTLKYFPNSNNIYSYFLKSEIFSRILDRFMFQNNLKNINDIGINSDMKQLYFELVNNEKVIKELGYEKMPETMYLDLMGIQYDKLNNQQLKKISGKQKRNLFLSNQ